MKRNTNLKFVFLCAALALILKMSLGIATQPTNASHLRLIDRLDRPQDGYCADIHGVMGNFRTDLPLFVHNCKQGLTSDSAVQFNSLGQIIFVDLNVCITVAGVNSKALPGSAVLLRECDEATPFFEAEKLQRFSHNKNGQLELLESGLCLTVGAQSATTYSMSDRWRPLFVSDCATAESTLSHWEFFVPIN